MQLKVIKYLEYIYNKQNQNQIDEGLLSTISTSLKNDITVEINGRIIENCEFLVNNFSEKFLYTVALNLKEKIYSPDEIIYYED